MLQVLVHEFESWASVQREKSLQVRRHVREPALRVPVSALVPLEKGGFAWFVQQPSSQGRGGGGRSWIAQWRGMQGI